jgi:SAM-dependent methyltransferase
MNSDQGFLYPVFSEWTLYDRIIRLNYMKHQEIGDSIHSGLLGIRPPLRVVDLGCGCGQMAARSLKGLKVESYLGVDLAPAGLGRIPTHLSSVTQNCETRESGIVDFLRSELNWTPNVILASFSLHHFECSELGSILAGIKQKLALDGRFIWVDPVRRSDESREEFIRRFMKEIADSWSDLDSSEFQEVEEHITSSDYPLDQIERQRLTESVDFKKEETLYQDSLFRAEVYVSQR